MVDWNFIIERAGVDVSVGMCFFWIIAMLEEMGVRCMPGWKHALRPGSGDSQTDSLLRTPPGLLTEAERQMREGAIEGLKKMGWTVIGDENGPVSLRPPPLSRKY